MASDPRKENGMFGAPIVPGSPDEVEQLKWQLALQTGQGPAYGQSQQPYSPMLSDDDPNAPLNVDDYIRPSAPVSPEEAKWATGVRAELGKPTISPVEKPAPGFFDNLNIKDYAALSSAAGVLGSMFLSRPQKRVRAGGPTASPGGNFFLRRTV